VEDGLLLGTEDGSLEGVEDGLLLGTEDGSLEVVDGGLLLGTDDGSLEGVVDGGLLLGTDDSALEVVNEGLLLGTDDGSLDGEVLGAENELVVGEFEVGSDDGMLFSGFDVGLALGDGKQLKSGNAIRTLFCSFALPITMSFKPSPLISAIAMACVS